MVHYPLVSDPGTEFPCNNVSSHYLGIIVDRACGTDLRAFANEHPLYSDRSGIGRMVRFR
jgi:hypothetical protein